MSDHWTRIAAERIEAGEDEIACLADYGYVPVDGIERLTAELVTMQERERLACVKIDELQAKLNAVTVSEEPCPTNGCVRQDPHTTDICVDRAWRYINPSISVSERQEREIRHCPSCGVDMDLYGCWCKDTLERKARDSDRNGR